jgi:hypothetical protein
MKFCHFRRLEKSKKIAVGVFHFVVPKDYTLTGFNSAAGVLSWLFNDSDSIGTM